MPEQQTLASMRNMPKVDLHRHLEGSLRVSTLLELARNRDVDLPSDPRKLCSLTTMTGSDLKIPAVLLRKFHALRRVYTSPELIMRFTREAVEDAAADNVVHLEMRFSPLALTRIRGFPVSDVLGWVVEAAAQASERNGMTVCLIASVNRHEPLESASEIAEAVVDQMGEHLVGFDLAGDEETFPADPFLPLFRELQQDGLRITVHAGEWSGAAAVRQAVMEFSADRIGHGVRVVADPGVMELARENAVPFEVCPYSNICSGIAGSLEDHPIREMLARGLYVTLNTDNPGILQSTLSAEAATLIGLSGISPLTIQGMMLNAARASFLSGEEKQKLEAELCSAYELTTD